MTYSKLTIGVLAEQTGTSVPTIRYYEEIGLLSPAERSPSGHRRYNAADLTRLNFIRRCRDFRFPIEQVREMIALFDDGDRACSEARDLAQAHLSTVRSKLAELAQLEASLVGFVASCDQVCCDGPTRNCTIIEDLSGRTLQTPQA